MIHLTLLTGHARYSPRDEVEQQFLDHLAPLVLQANLGRQPVPGFPGAEIQLTSERRALIATVWRGEIPLATWGVAPDAESAGALWPILVQQQAIMPGWDRSRVQRPDSTPWCAVALLGLGAHPDDAHWLGDCERCIAWAWIEGVS